jgi:hypothetical protein
MGRFPISGLPRPAVVDRLQPPEIGKRPIFSCRGFRPFQAELRQCAYVGQGQVAGRGQFLTRRTKTHGDRHGGDRRGHECSVLSADRDARPRCCLVGPHIGQADDSIQEWAPPDARDPSVDAVTRDDETAFLRERPRIVLLQHETHKLALPGAHPDDAQTPLSDEERLVHSERPLEIGFVGIRQSIRVAAKNEVPFFEPQQSLGLDSERSQPV